MPRLDTDAFRSRLRRSPAPVFSGRMYCVRIESNETPRSNAVAPSTAHVAAAATTMGWNTLVAAGGRSCFAPIRADVVVAKASGWRPTVLLRAREATATLSQISRERSSISGGAATPPPLGASSSPESRERAVTSAALEGDLLRHSLSELLDIVTAITSRRLLSAYATAADVTQLRTHPAQWITNNFAHVVAAVPFASLLMATGSMTSGGVRNNVIHFPR
mmetsp:Transcript_7266/g.8966  ORF Transcript_7266/g.8966 Transcript_7266/m.8966 type:complete len:220 (-) Transcript_7266:141-800(-)